MALQITYSTPMHYAIKQTFDASNRHDDRPRAGLTRTSGTSALDWGVLWVETRRIEKVRQNVVRLKQLCSQGCEKLKAWRRRSPENFLHGDLPSRYRSAAAQALSNSW